MLTFLSPHSNNRIKIIAHTITFTSATIVVSNPHPMGTSLHIIPSTMFITTLKMQLTITNFPGDNTFNLLYTPFNILYNYMYIFFLFDCYEHYRMTDSIQFVIYQTTNIRYRPNNQIRHLLRWTTR